jgi:large subunit ribosomal protein L14
VTSRDVHQGARRSKRRYAHIGDVIKVTVKDAAPRGRVKKGEIQRRRGAHAPRRAPRRRREGLLTRTPPSSSTPNSNRSARASRPVTRELCTERFMKIVSLAPEVPGGTRCARSRKATTSSRIAGRTRQAATSRVLDEHVLVAGINQVKHQRPNPMKGEQGGIVTKDMPIHI